MSNTTAVVIALLIAFSDRWESCLIGEQPLKHFLFLHPSLQSQWALEVMSLYCSLLGRRGVSLLPATLVNDSWFPGTGLCSWVRETSSLLLMLYCELCIFGKVCLCFSLCLCIWVLSCSTSEAIWLGSVTVVCCYLIKIPFLVVFLIDSFF